MTRRSTAPIVSVLVVALVVVLAGCGTGRGPDVPPIVPVSPALPVSSPPVSSPAASPSPGAPARPGRPVTILLDPGHNGGNAADPAAIDRPVPDGRGGTKPCNTTGTATAGGYPEHAFTWDVAARVARRLQAAGITVRTTRPDDRGVGPCVDRRAAQGNEPGVTAVVSIHADGAVASGRGFHVATSAPPLGPSQRGPSSALAADLVAGMRAGGFVPSTYRGRGGLDPRDDLAGLNLSRVPTALVECANMRNAGEAAVVSSPDGRERYAAALADGIVRWAFA